jgi:DNA-binding protein HU-beta
MPAPRDKTFHLGFVVPSAHRLNAELGETMTQSQIVQTLADKCEVTKKQSKMMMDHLAETAIAQVKKNGVFVLPGIGRLVRLDRKARMGRNPATGETIKIAAKKVVKFRVAKAAKDAIVPAKKK